MDDEFEDTTQLAFEENHGPEEEGKLIAKLAPYAHLLAETLEARVQSAKFITEVQAAELEAVGWSETDTRREEAGSEDFEFQICVPELHDGVIDPFPFSIDQAVVILGEMTGHLLSMQIGEDVKYILNSIKSDGWCAYDHPDKGARKHRKIYFLNIVL